MARISRKTEVPSTLTLRVEVKEPTVDEKTPGDPGIQNQLINHAHYYFSQKVHDMIIATSSIICIGFGS